GTDNIEGWLYRAERYFAFLGFAEEYWLPFPFFYFDVFRSHLYVFNSAYEIQSWKEDHVFDKLPEKYHTVDAWDLTNGASSNFDDRNASVHEEQQSALVVDKVSDTSICGNDNLPLEVTIQVLDESSHNIKLGEK
ncbi:hypothetical protein MTR67_052472, partial [Solanum verrucosum]